MKNIIVVSLLSLFLVGCASSPKPTPIVTKSCNPASELLVEEKTLEQKRQINKNEIDLKEALKFWSMDIEEYNKLLEKNNELIKHVNKFCR